jgi:hypothetical protein
MSPSKMSPGRARFESPKNGSEEPIVAGSLCLLLRHSIF